MGKNTISHMHDPSLTTAWHIQLNLDFMSDRPHSTRGLKGVTRAEASSDYYSDAWEVADPIALTKEIMSRALGSKPDLAYPDVGPLHESLLAMKFVTGNAAMESRDPVHSLEDWYIGPFKRLHDLTRRGWLVCLAKGCRNRFGTEFETL